MGSLQHLSSYLKSKAGGVQTAQASCNEDVLKSGSIDKLFLTSPLDGNGQLHNRCQLYMGLGGPQSPSGRYGKETNLLPPLGIEPWLLGCPTRSLVTVLKELSRH